MRGHKNVRILYAADRAGLALLLAMVLVAGSLASALSASAAEQGNPGNSGSHGNPGNSGGQGGSHGNPGNEGNSGSHGNPGNSGGQGGSHGNPGNEGNGGSHGNPGNEGNGNPGNSNNGNGNPGKGNNGNGPDEEAEEPELPDEEGEEEDDGDQVLGSRLVRSRVTLTYGNGAFRGRVFSQRNRCEAGRTVNVKRRNGTLIGRDKTNRKGRFAVQARKQTGRFKARVGRKSFKLPQRDVKVVCLADRSLLRITAK